MDRRWHDGRRGPRGDRGSGRAGRAHRPPAQPGARPRPRPPDHAGAVARRAAGDVRGRLRRRPRARRGRLVDHHRWRVRRHPLLWETLTRGRSPGKAAMGLRVVRPTGARSCSATPWPARSPGSSSTSGSSPLFTGLIGIVVSASSARGQRVGDLLAGTIVVRERLPRTGLQKLPPPDPVLAAWARGCAASRLPDDLALAARQFLVRAPQLAGAVRASLADRLAVDVSARVAPPPPPGVPAEAYLLAVLGERRRRETIRAHGRHGVGTSGGRRRRAPRGGRRSAPTGSASLPRRPSPRRRAPGRRDATTPPPRPAAPPHPVENRLTMWDGFPAEWAPIA